MKDIDRLKKACALMRETGTDSSQYILIREDDLEELIEAWERDRKIVKLAREIVNAVKASEGVSE